MDQTANWTESYRIETDKELGEKLFGDRGYRPPGYGGYIPFVQNEIGKSYGETTRASVKNKELEKDSSLQLEKLKSSRDDPLTFYVESRTAKSQQIANSCPQSGFKAFTNDYSYSPGKTPGYGGYVPGLKTEFGKPYGFHTAKLESSEKKTNHQPKEEFVTTAKKDFRVAAEDTPSSPRTQFVPGYTGHISHIFCNPGKSPWKSSSETKKCL